MRTHQRNRSDTMRNLIASLAAAALSLGGAFSHAAEAFPSKPVRIIVPYSAGGPIYIIARGLTAQLGQDWKAGAIVENKPGGNEIVGAAELARSPADGYTLLLGTDSVFSQNQFLYNKLPYDPDALVPVTRLALANLVMFVPPDFPASNMKEFIAYVRAHPNKVNYGSAGVGNITHLSMASMEKKYGLRMTHVPYKGLAPAIQDMLAGQIQVAFGMGSVVEPYIKSGKIKALAISGARRAKVFPTVPTLTESGFPDVECSLNVCLFAPRGTPPALANAIAADVRKVLLEPEFRSRYIDDVAFEMAASTPEEFAAFIVKDRPIQKARIEASGARLD
jgi:tripartite-type tricarboxylate transporter receptor subunit TctC